MLKITMTDGSVKVWQIPPAQPDLITDPKSTVVIGDTYPFDKADDTNLQIIEIDGPELESLVKTAPQYFSDPAPIAYSNYVGLVQGLPAYDRATALTFTSRLRGE